MACELMVHLNASSSLEKSQNISFFLSLHLNLARSSSQNIVSTETLLKEMFEIKILYVLTFHVKSLIAHNSNFVFPNLKLKNQYFHKGK